MKKYVMLVSAYLIIGYGFAQETTWTACTKDSFVVNPVTVSLGASNNDCGMEILPDAQKRLIADFNKQSLLFSCPDILKAYANLINDCRKGNDAKGAIMYFDYHLARVIDEKIKTPIPGGKTIIDSFNKTYNDLYVSKKGVDPMIAAKTTKAYFDPYASRPTKPSSRVECAKMDLSKVTSLSQIMDANYVCQNIRDLRLGCEQYFDANAKPVPGELLFDKSSNQTVATQLCVQQLSTTFDRLEKKVNYFQKTISSDYRQQQTKLATKLFNETLNNIITTFDTVDSKFGPVLAKTQCKAKSQ